MTKRDIRQGSSWRAETTPRAKWAERPDTLTQAQFEFCLAYIANGFNATAAYRAAYPKVGAPTAATNGYRLLRNADVVAFLEPELQARWHDQQMNGEEALARLASQARADVRQLFDRRGQLLPPHRWPDEIASCVKSIQRGPGGVKVTLVDALAAVRLILENTGKLKGRDNGISVLAAAIRGDLAESERVLGR